MGGLDHTGVIVKKWGILIRWVNPDKTGLVCDPDKTGSFNSG